MVEGAKYYLEVELGKTVCEKSDGPMPFSAIQKCELLPSNQQEVRSDAKFTMSKEECNEQICQMFAEIHRLVLANDGNASLNCLLEDLPNKTSS